MKDSDREWLETIREACALPPQEAPHIGPPLLTRLVDTLLRQDTEIDLLLKIEKIAKALISIPMPPHMMSDQNPHYVLIMELYGALNRKGRETDK